MKTLLAFLLFLSFSTFYAQEADMDINPEWREKGDTQFGILIAATANTLFFDDFPEMRNIDGNGFLVGVQGEYFFGKNWSLRGRVNFEKRDFSRGFDDNYIAVPVLAAWHFGKNRRWHLQLGPAYSLSLGDNLNSSLGSNLGIGLIIPIGNLKFFLELDGLTTSTSDITFTDLNGNPFGEGFLNGNRSSLNIGFLF